MIKIIFKEGQGLGNQLWLFCSAKSIAEKLKVDLQIINYKNFKGIDFLKLDCNNFHEINFKINHNMSNNIFHERSYYDHELKYIISSYDQIVLDINEDKILEGNFQSEDYFYGNLDKIKRYITLDESYKNFFKIPKDVCILNIRGGEYKRHRKFILPKSYWLNGINNFKKRFNVDKFLIVTDDYKYAKSLFNSFEIISGNIGECYASIYNCSNLLASNSSFSYFPCRNGPQKNIIGPMYWARHQNNYNRWISPGNIYENWLWQDKNANLKTHRECISIAKESDSYYKKNFNILINKKDIPYSGLFKFIPHQMKKRLKKILSHLFPRIIG